MKKENIFDLYAAQHKDDPAPAADRVPGEVKPEDVAPAPEQKPEPEPEPEKKPEPEQKTPEGGEQNGV